MHFNCYTQGPENPIRNGPFYLKMVRCTKISKGCECDSFVLIPNFWTNVLTVIRDWKNYLKRIVDLAVRVKYSFYLDKSSATQLQMLVKNGSISTWEGGAQLAQITLTSLLLYPHIFFVFIYQFPLQWFLPQYIIKQKFG